MQKPEWILFDCMETIIDVVIMPEVRTYSFWGYDGCGYESLWASSDSFIEEYVHIRENLRSNHEQYREFNSLDLYCLMVADKLPEQQVKMAADSILKNFWRNYTKNCYVDETVKQTLKELSSKYHCGVVSNFMVDGGIEDLLMVHGILPYFDFVVTSVRVGWKKPHSNIYDAAMANIRVPKNKVLFIGDNYDCDYTGPREYGFQSILLDKKNRYPQVPEKINLIRELPDMLEKSIL
ncbi:MAG: HAD family hydrolase [Ruminiclostridium sp.]|nr:HAD family hydrolase [Ruminiclostridium sp.]